VEHGSRAILSSRNGRNLQLLKINNLWDRFLGAFLSEAIFKSQGIASAKSASQ
jgi:hypothetical protein